MAKSLAEQMIETPPADAEVHYGDRIEQDIKPGKSATVFQVSTDPLTVDKVLKDANIDRKEWIVERMQPNQWQGFAKTPVKFNEKGWPVEWAINIVTLYQLKVWLKPMQNRWMLDAGDFIIDGLKKYRPKWGNPPKHTGGEWLAVCGLYDVHFGKLAWRGETHNNYDLKATQKLYRDAITQMLKAVSPYRIAQWEFPVGQDFLHIDNTKNRTANDTPQDVDSRLPKIVDLAEGEARRAIKRLREVAPVSVRYHASNHDRLPSWFITRALAQSFAGVDGIEVDTSWHHRKYITYGKNLIGLTHGDKTKDKRLVTLMPQEQPEAWAQSICREWLTGHIHHEKVMMVREAEEQDGVSVRTLRSMSAADAYHYEHGYLSDRAVELHMYHKSGLQQLRFVFRVPKA